MKSWVGEHLLHVWQFDAGGRSCSMNMQTKNFFNDTHVRWLWQSWELATVGVSEYHIAYNFCARKAYKRAKLVLEVQQFKGQVGFRCFVGVDDASAFPPNVVCSKPMDWKVRMRRANFQSTMPCSYWVQCLVCFYGCARGTGCSAYTFETCRLIVSWSRRNGTRTTISNQMRCEIRRCPEPVAIV